MLPRLDKAAAAGEMSRTEVAAEAARMISMLSGATL
jgi:hypothetical protein